MQGTKKRRLNKKELEKQLNDCGIEVRSTAKKLEELCEEKGLPIEVEKQKNLKDGLISPKGCCKCYGGEDSLMKLNCSNTL